MLSDQRCLYALFITLSCLTILGFGATQLHPDEVVVFQQIAKTLGKEDWNVNDPCNNLGWKTPDDPNSNITITCNCTVGNDGACHIETILLKGLSLPGELPPEFVDLPYLQIIDLTRNYLHGTIPSKWGSFKKLTIMSLVGNRLHGSIPKEIGDIITLQELVLEANQLSGEIPPELGNLANLKRLVISSNYFTGTLPDDLSRLNLTDFRISDNQFTGKIPDFIPNWTGLTRLRIQASGLDGPIPPGIFSLEKLEELRISDIAGLESAFPPVGSMTSMKTLVLRNCNLSGQIPKYVGESKDLTNLDLSFNNLRGEIESALPSSMNRPTYMYLTHNLLNGSVPQWFLEENKYYDLSYNKFTLENSTLNICSQDKVNLFQSTSAGNNLSGVIPCLESQGHCKRTYSHLGINCGGVTLDDGSRYEKDNDKSGASTFLNEHEPNWALSSTGYFVDNKTKEFVTTANQSKFPGLSDLYITARLSPLSLTYYGFCLDNGIYTVKLHFAEIEITDDGTYSSLGRRIFDIYIQGNLELKDFNIKEAAKGSGKEIVKKFYANVENNTLEIHFYWAGKGTTNIPNNGTYGPLISAITIDYVKKHKISVGAVIGIVASVVSFILLVLVGILWRRGFLGGKTIGYQRERNWFH